MIRHRMRGFDKLEARIGVQEAQHYPDGTSVAYVAAIHEYGHQPSGIPQRSFMRTTTAAKRQEWRDGIKDGAEAVMHGVAGAEQVLEAVGMSAAGDVKQTISTITEPPLKPLTIRRKGHSKPLVDTGLLLQSITSKVAKKGE